MASKMRVSLPWTATVAILIAFADVARGFSKTAQGEERETLLELKREWGMPPVLSNWSIGTDHCDGWEGVTCDNNGFVTAIELHSPSVAGDLPLMVGYLTRLIKIDLSYTKLEGSIPKDIGYLPSLEILDLSYSRMGGYIPEEIGNAQSLKELWLTGCNFTGPLPVSIARLTNLTHLMVGGNSLHGHLPVGLTNLMNIKYFVISGNNFSGPIPYELGYMVSVEHLHLDNNSFTGDIPRTFGSLPALSHLLLHDNHLTGIIPLELGDISTLNTLDLSGNSFVGSLPYEVGRLQKLEILYCRFCNLTGQLPELPDMASLKIINLSHNQLRKSLPDSWGTSTALTAINLADNKYKFVEWDDPKPLKLEGNPYCNPKVPKPFPSYCIPAITSAPNLALKKSPSCPLGKFPNGNLPKGKRRCVEALTATLTLTLEAEDMSFSLGEFQGALANALHITSERVLLLSVRPDTLNSLH